MNYDPATVRAVVAHLRRLADNAASAALRDPQRAMGYRTSANAILRQFGPEAPAPEPSTDTLRGLLEEAVPWLDHEADDGRELARRIEAALAATPSREEKK